jgi:hypothetical protein
MNRVFAVLILILVCAACLGFYLGWFQFESTKTGGQTHITLTVDQKKIQADEQKAEDKVRGIGDHQTEKKQNGRCARKVFSLCPAQGRNIVALHPDRPSCLSRNKSLGFTQAYSTAPKDYRQRHQVQERRSQRIGLQADPHNDERCRHRHGPNQQINEICQPECRGAGDHPQA